MNRAKQTKAQLIQEVTTLRQRIADLKAADAVCQQTEETLRQYQMLYRSLFEYSNDPMLTLSLEGRFTSVNRAMISMLGWSREELIGCHYSVVATPAALAQWDGRTRRALAGERLPPTFESEICRKDGQVIPIECRTGFIRDEAGTPVGIQGTYRNLTERKRFAEQLLQLQKMQAIGTLAGGIAHDFNNILAVIMGYTELATYDLPSTSPAWHNLQQVLAASKRARDLVQQILTFSRKTEQERKPIKLAPLIEEALRLLRASLPATIDICQDLVADTGTVLADPTQMQQVLLNLCANAACAMRETGGLLYVGLEAVEGDAALTARHPELQPGPYLRLTVRDTGCGIGPEVLERIFEPFFTTKQVGAGTGMGLAVVHGIIVSHSGTITVQSTPGNGTTCAIYLPRLPEAAAGDMPPEDVIPRGKGRILFVDDEDAIAHLGQALLEPLGYEVIVSNSSLAALEAFRAATHRFDLVVTDQTMPTMTGEALARALRQIRPDIPIILCTGFSYTMDADKARALGIDAFLLKPLRAWELSATIQQVLAHRVSQECNFTN
jgi:PAS domain S-box-containing protein